MPGRRWSDGLHQAVEAKEGVKVESENVTYATITIQNYYRMYEKLSGMTGTASTESEEFHKIYKLDVVEIPTNLDYLSGRSDLPLNAGKDSDDEGYKFTFYYTDDSDAPTFFKRKDYPDVIYRTEEAKFRAIGEELLRFHTMGRPILVGTTSVELSERISGRMKADPVRKLAQVILLRHAWMEVNKREFDGRKVEELEFLNRPLGLLPAAQMRTLAREIDHNLNPLSDSNLDELLDILRLSPDHKERLATVLKNGVNHQVLNARKHTEESQIIADAGAFGAVTIATNMAGRGVDIKLGGELPEEVLSQVNRVLRRTGIEDPFELSMENRLAALDKLGDEDFGIYHEDIQAFRQYMHDSSLVKELGGLHVIGSERHDSRRIDNQLRGRSGRQGDPGSSRFYLSLQDDLMRLFGGAQAEGLMGRLNIDDDMPIEMGIVSRIVEQSQTRVEGANFDTRKHLLEYDDVLNKQRATIYDQRDRVMTKGDLSEDVNEMLEFEVRRRAPEALEDPEGPWRLLAWLGETQPPLFFGNAVYPSYSQKLMMRELTPEMTDRVKAEAAFLKLAEQSLEAEKEHILDAVNAAMENAEIWAETQQKDRSDTLDVFMEGLEMADETDTRSAKELETELVTLLRTPLRLNSDEQREVRREPELLGEIAERKIENYVATNAVRRVVAVAERNLRASIDMVPRDLVMDDFNSYSDQILEAVEKVFSQRKDTLIGENRDGRLAKDIRAVLDEFKTLDEIALMNVLLRLPQGQRATFDRKTKQRVWTRTTRLTFRYHAANMIEEMDGDTLTEDLLKHLDDAQTTQQRFLGALQLNQFGGKVLRDLPEDVQDAIGDLLSDAGTELSDGDRLSTLDAELAQRVASELGCMVQTRTYRDLLLRVLGQLWIDYLTQMEALRVSVGLEAYGQRDPLVKYKSQASEFFQVLISDSRTGVVARMFTFQPRMLSLESGDKSGNGAGTAAPAFNGQSLPAGQMPGTFEPDGEPQQALNQSGSKKRRRRRKKKK